MTPPLTATALPADRRPTSTVALILVTAVSPFATDTYLAALPAMQHSLQTTSSLVQATLTAFVVGFAAGQLITGPISDARGRRSYTVCGAAVFTIASAAAALAPTIWILLAARVVQGVGGGACVVAGRAMVTDRFGPADAAKRLATLFSFLLLGPIVAPVLGGLVLPSIGWRGVFGILTVLGIAMTAAALIGLPETLPGTARSRTGLWMQLHRFGELLATPPIRRLLLANALGSAAIFVYLGGSSLVYQTDLGADAATFSLLFGASAGTTAAVSVVFRRLVTPARTERLHLVGAATSFAAAAVLAALAVTTAAPPLLGVAAAAAGALAGNGFIAPAAMIRLQRAGHRAAATATALGSATAYLGRAVAAPLAGLLGPPRLITMAVPMAVLFGLQLLLLLSHVQLQRRPSHRSAAARTPSTEVP